MAFRQFSVNRYYWVLDYKHYSQRFTLIVVSMGLVVDVVLMLVLCRSRSSDAQINN
jgi:hypothetical protein